MIARALIAGIAALLMATSAARAQDAKVDPLESKQCTCTRFEGNIRCNFACMSTPGPEIIAALRKRFSDFESAESVFDELNGGYQVTFYTKDGFHRACMFTPPAKLGKCRIIHA
jgi:hypothetical protein